MTTTETDIDSLIDNVLDQNKKLIIWNDEVNTFENVIIALIEVCKHSQEQAEQCTMIIHNNGKCEVKNGKYESLKILKDAMIDRGIQSTIE